MSYAVRICPPTAFLDVDDPSFPADPCPADPSITHTPAPRGFLAQMDWAERMLETHDQRRCPGCGLWKIWVPFDGLGLA